MKKNVKPEGDKPGIGKSLILLSVGLMLGLAIGFFIFKNSETDQKTVSSINPAAIQPTKRTSQFINPLAESEAYKGFEMRPAPKLGEAIQKTIDDITQNGQAQNISVYLRDLTNDQVIGINEDNRFSPASLMKVPVLITLLKYSEDFPATLQHPLTYSGPSAVITEKEANIDKKTIMIPGHSYSIDQLLEIMIMESDNEATLLLLNYIDRVAPRFRQKVETDLKLVTNNKNFDEDFLTVRRYSSFFRVLYNASYLNKEMSAKALNILSQTGYGNGIRQSVPAEITVSQKYGHRQVGPGQHQYHHFAIVYHPKKPFLLGIMTKGKSEQELQSAIASITTTAYTTIDTFAGKNRDYLSRDVD